MRDNTFAESASECKDLHFTSPEALNPDLISGFRGYHWNSRAMSAFRGGDGVGSMQGAYWMARSRRRFFSGSKALVTRRLYNTIARGSLRNTSTFGLHLIWHADMCATGKGPKPPPVAPLEHVNRLEVEGQLGTTLPCLCKTRRAGVL